jgi:hypothetical protein
MGTYAQLYNSAWPTEYQNAQNTGLSPYSGPGLLRIKWNQNLDSWRCSSVIGKDNVVYFPSNDGCLYAYYPDGTLKWKFTATSDNLMTNPTICSDGTILLSAGKRLFSINPIGYENWHLDFGNDLTNPKVLDDGQIIVGAGYTLYSIDKSSAINWSFICESRIASFSLAIDHNQNIVFVAEGAKMYSINKSGVLNWNKLLPSYRIYPGTPTIDSEGSIYYTSNDELIAIYPNGDVKWRVHLALNMHNPTPAIQGNRLYIADDDSMYCFSSNGSKIWSDKIPHENSPSYVCIARNIIYLHHDGSLYLYTKEGILIQKILFLDKYAAPILSSDSIIYMGGIAFEQITEPSIQSSNIKIEDVVSSSRIQFSWLPGNGNSWQTFIKQTDDPDDIPTPTYNLSLNSSTSFGDSRCEIPNTGWYSIYLGGSSITVSNLENGKAYKMMILEYNDDGSYNVRQYNNKPSVNNPIIFYMTNDGLVPKLNTTPSSRLLNSNSGSTTFTVTSNVDWSVEENANWLSATKTNGTTLTIIYDANEDLDSRSCTITLSGSGVTSQNVTLEQAGETPTLSVSPMSRTVNSTAGSTTFAVTSNVDWTVEENSEWLTTVKTNETTLTVNYNANEDLDSRSGTITLSGSGVTSQNVTFEQEGKTPTLIVSPLSKTVNSTAGSTTFTITSNVDWSVNENSEWLTTVKTNETTLTINYDANQQLVTRSATITILGQGVTSINITLLQEGVIQTSYILTDDDVTVSNGVIESCSYNFSIKDIIIPSILDRQTVTGIADYLFYNKGLTAVELPTSLRFIGFCAFWKNYIKSVSIPSSVSFIGEYAFADNPLISVTFETNSDISFIGNSAFSNYSHSLNSIKLPVNSNPSFVNYKDYFGNTFAEGDNITNFITSYYAVPYILTDADVVVRNGIVESCSYDFLIKNIIIPNNLNGQIVTGIGDDYNKLFYNKGITSVELPSNLQIIGRSAFEQNSLSSITIPNSVTIIGDWAFSLNSITSITIPNSVNMIGVGAFGANHLSGITIPNSITIISDYAFQANNLKNIIIPNSVTIIGEGAFSNNSLTSVTIPNNVISIDDYAFEYNSLLSVIFETNSNISSIGKGAFNGNNDLNPIKLPVHANIYFIEYKDCNGKIYAKGDNISDFSICYYARIPHTLTDDEVTVNNGIIESCSYNFAIKDIAVSNILDGQIVTGIGDDFTHLFFNKEIVSVQLPNTLKNIGYRAFYWNSLNSLVIPNSVITIGKEAFRGNSLTSVIFEANSNISLIEYAAFYRNKLSTITLPVHADPSFIEYRDGWGTPYSEGDNITEFTTKYYARLPYVLTNEDVVVSNGIIESCNYDFTIKDIIIPNSLDGQTITGIGDNSSKLFNNKGILTVQLPSSLINVGNAAFDKNSLTSVTIPNSVTNIGGNAFSNNFLTSIYIGNSVENIKDYAFAGNNLKSLIIPNSVTTLGNSSFYNNSLTSITIPNSVVNIGSYAFHDNPLKSFILPLPVKQGYDFVNWNGSIPANTEVKDLTIAYTANFNLVGVSELTHQSVKLYPNPVYDKLNIDGLFPNHKSLQIFDIKGKLLKQTYTKHLNKISIDVSGLRAGVYFVKIDGQSFSFFKI